MVVPPTVLPKLGPKLAAPSLLQSPHHKWNWWSAAVLTHTHTPSLAPDDALGGKRGKFAMGFPTRRYRFCGGNISRSTAPMCLHTSWAFQVVPFGTRSHKGSSKWETTFPEGTRSFSFCSTASMQTRYLEGIRKISYVISSLFLERRQKSKRKQNRAPPGIHKEETKNMIKRLDPYFLKMTCCSPCYISGFLLSLRIEILAWSK